MLYSNVRGLNMARNKLSIYLIKEGINEENIFDEDSNIQLLKKYNNNKKLYYIPSWIHSPSLMNFLVLNLMNYNKLILEQY